MIPFRGSEPLSDQCDFLSRSRGAFLRLLLKGMQNIDRVLETDGIHTNGLENFWSLLKRTISGTYVGVEPFHLFR
jgi:hypothetical protein